ncbi:MAG TPA: XrtA/PEP-CTERM system histidine kinase PrsK [Allosphingosinicella sp.]|nr:XrtA/PEP-CTERM system histidine kinase PrsK [Allosphingosinicella sp.]
MSMAALIGVSHALAAVAFAALALWQMREAASDTRSRWMAAAFAATALWALAAALLGPAAMAAGLAESARNFAFLGFMYAIVRSAAAVERQRAVRIVYAVVAGAIGVQLTIAGVIPEFTAVPVAYQALLAAAQMIGLTIAAGALVLVHNLYGQAAPDSRWGLKLPTIALGAMWAYDLHLYTIGYLSRTPPGELIAFRGAVMLLLSPLFLLALRRGESWRIHLSRAATFQSFSLLAILAYLILMMTAARALEIAGGEWGAVAQIGLLLAMTATAMLALPSARLRAWARVIVAKHFFEHRYDYREEWLRFTRAVGAAGDSEAPIGERVVKALADMAGAPGGLLIVPDEHRRLSVEAAWRWDAQLPATPVEAAALVGFLEANAHVVDFGRPDTALPLPPALAGLGEAWAGVPLLHKDRLAGFVILAHPLLRRPLDWEDFDLFRTAGTQAASYLAEARTQEALANAQRFDEFNRRFAFILHDIKNLVSQLSLVARNAERHAHNPAFREDMIATLQASVKKMNDLLARLSPGRSGEAERPRPADLEAVLRDVAEMKRRVHPVVVEAPEPLLGLADPVGLGQALGHLVQNAIDASPADAPVVLSLGARGKDAVIEVRDEGGGMSADFVRGRLFQPFASTKDSGFGVGAFEARALVAAMGGRLEVRSREGEGTCFTILLPLVADNASLPAERMCA